MANDNDDDNILPFAPRKQSSVALPADALLEDSLGEYEEVIVVGVDADGEMVVTGNISNIAEVYDLLSTAAQNIALAHLDMLFPEAKH